MWEVALEEIQCLHDQVWSCLGPGGRCHLNEEGVVHATAKDILDLPRWQRTTVVTRVVIDIARAHVKTHNDGTLTLLAIATRVLLSCIGLPIRIHDILEGIDDLMDQMKMFIQHLSVPLTFKDSSLFESWARSQLVAHMKFEILSEYQLKLLVNVSQQAALQLLSTRKSHESDVYNVTHTDPLASSATQIVRVLPTSYIPSVDMSDTRSNIEFLRDVTVIDTPSIPHGRWPTIVQQGGIPLTVICIEPTMDFSNAFDDSVDVEVSINASHLPAQTRYKLFHDIVKIFVEANIHVVMCQRVIPPILQSLMLKSGILCFERVSNRHFSAVCKTCGAIAWSDWMQFISSANPLHTQQSHPTSADSPSSQIIQSIRKQAGLLKSIRPLDPADENQQYESPKLVQLQGFQNYQLNLDDMSAHQKDIYVSILTRWNSNIAVPIPMCTVLVTSGVPETYPTTCLPHVIRRLIDQFSRLLQSPYLVPGGGGVEMTLAVALLRSEAPPEQSEIISPSSRMTSNTAKCFNGTQKQEKDPHHTASIGCTDGNTEGSTYVSLNNLYIAENHRIKTGRRKTKVISALRQVLAGVLYSVALKLTGLDDVDPYDSSATDTSNRSAYNDASTIDVQKWFSLNLEFAKRIGMFNDCAGSGVTSNAPVQDPSKNSFSKPSVPCFGFDITTQRLVSSVFYTCSFDKSKYVKHLGRGHLLDSAHVKEKALLAALTAVQTVLRIMTSYHNPERALDQEK